MRMVFHGMERGREDFLHAFSLRNIVSRVTADPSSAPAPWINFTRRRQRIQAGHFLWAALGSKARLRHDGVLHVERQCAMKLPQRHLSGGISFSDEDDDAGKDKQQQQ